MQSVRWFTGLMNSYVARNRRAAWFVFAAAYFLGMTVFLFVLLAHRSYDDPFIIYRYAQNLADGHGLVYNFGERVLSVTTPLFTLILAGAAWLGLDVRLAAFWLGAASLAFGGLCFWQLGRLWKTPGIGWVGLGLYPLLPFVAASLGSEMSFVLAIGLFAVLQLQVAVEPGESGNGALFRAAFAMGLAVLARPDSLVLLGLLTLAVGWYIRQGRLSAGTSWRAAGITVSLLLAWGVFGLWYYGSPIPVTLLAKQNQGQMLISSSFWAGLGALGGRYLAQPHYQVALLLALFGLLDGLRRRHPALLVIAWSGAFVASYVALGVSRYSWYYVPLAPGLAAATGLGVNAVARFGRAALGERPGATWRTWALQAAFTATLVLLVALQGRNLVSLAKQPDPRSALYQTLGLWLRQSTPPDAVVAALEVGILGYYAQRTMVDFSGLIQPAITRRLTPEATYDDSSVWAVEHYRPDWVVAHDGLFPLLESWLGANCRPEYTARVAAVKATLWQCPSPP